MTRAARFLGSFGRALSGVMLYRRGHPALERAIEASWRDLHALLAVTAQPAFTFIGESVLFGDAPLPGRGGWEWSERLSAAGIQRVQFDGPPTRDTFESFLFEVFARLGRHNPQSAESPPLALRGIRYGPVGLRGEAAGAMAPMPTATLGFSLDEEVDTVRWLHQEVQDRRPIPLAEVETIVRSLTIAMHAEPQITLPLVQLKEFDEYTTTHSLNVSVLGMGLAERVGLDGSEVRAYGVAGLLHDIGKTLIPLDILTKPGRFTDAEREVMNRHPVEGARLILRANTGLDLAAVVAYEHHIMVDGSGYPALRFRRMCHAASRLVQVCDVFDALRTRRPYRDGWPVEKAIAYLRERSGLTFDPDLVDAFILMMAESASGPVGTSAATTGSPAPTSTRKSC
jgi:putative nucleotidyltransferase with HDIG domain